MTTALHAKLSFRPEPEARGGETCFSTIVAGCPIFAPQALRWVFAHKHKPFCLRARLQPCRNRHSAKGALAPEVR